ncbi:MAG: integration host factor subunit beta [Acidobacteriota bacterium]|nr:integration host factor subunit beta [Acidobacteriota bacterium]
MTRAELIEEVSRAMGMTRKEAELVVEIILSAIARALRDGDKVEIRGFGSFHTRQRGPRLGRNPKTGAQVAVPAKRVPHFKPSKELRELWTNGKTLTIEAGHLSENG